MSDRWYRSVLMLLICGMAASSSVTASAQVTHPAGGASEAYERIQREAAAFAPGDPIEISTNDGRVLIGAFEIVNSDFVLLWVRHRNGPQPERVPILLIDTISRARPHPGPFGPFVPPMQRYPGPMPHPPWPLQYPPLREVGLHLSATLARADIFGMGGLSYTRSLTDVFALEGTVDGTHQAGAVVGFTSFKAMVRRYNPEVGEVFVALGVARGFSGGDEAKYPHGGGLVVGGGIQPRFSSYAAGRVEAQLVTFSHGMAGLRLSVGALVGFN